MMTSLIIDSGLRRNDKGRNYVFLEVLRSTKPVAKSAAENIIGAIGAPVAGSPPLVVSLGCPPFATTTGVAGGVALATGVGVTDGSGVSAKLISDDGKSSTISTVPEGVGVGIVTVLLLQIYHPPPTITNKTIAPKISGPKSVQTFCTLSFMFVC